MYYILGINKLLGFPGNKEVLHFNNVTHLGKHLAEASTITNPLHITRFYILINAHFRPQLHPTIAGHDDGSFGGGYEVIHS